MSRNILFESKCSKAMLAVSWQKSFGSLDFFWAEAAGTDMHA